MALYHLAQLNIGRVRGPIGSPVMAEFVALLDSVNKIADESPGFVWRLQDDTGNANNYLPYAQDPATLMNMSVWESVKTLRDFVYRSVHSQPLKRRAEWFERPTQAYTVLWWIPAGHVPSIAEAVERLEYRRANGDTPYAFSFANPFPPPGSEQVIARSPECGWQE
jgi:hypothetical protein